MEVQKVWIQRTGITLMLIAFLMNPFFLGMLFSPDGHIDTPVTRVIIISFEILLLMVGLGIYNYSFLMYLRKRVGKIILLIATIILFFVVIEVSIRLVGDYDSDGQFTFAGRAVWPYQLPVNSLKENILLFENLTNPYAIPDSSLGWTIANNSNSLRPPGYYQTNSMGVRSYREFNMTKEKGMLRIAMFGDSFIHSYDVPMNETLAFYLEKELSLKIPTEVMNFGVGAYGNDQAYLRWKLFGNSYHPDIVIIGFQAENCKRNVNLIRKFYFRETEIPFSKPRFILMNGSLLQVNLPTIPYRDVPSVVTNFDQSPLSKYESYYHPEDYSIKNPLLYSKFLRYLLTLIRDYTDKNKDRINYEGGSEIQELCTAILRTFYTEASANATVYILHLPTLQDVSLKMRSRDFVYGQLLSQLKKDFAVIDPTEDLLREAQQNTLDSLFVGHYSGTANEIVAKAIAKTISPANRSQGVGIVWD